MSKITGVFTAEFHQYRVMLESSVRVWVAPRELEPLSEFPATAEFYARVNSAGSIEAVRTWPPFDKRVFVFGPEYLGAIMRELGIHTPYLAIHAALEREWRRDLVLEHLKEQHGSRLLFDHREIVSTWLRPAGVSREPSHST